MSRISRQIDAYRAGTISLQTLASNLANVRPDPLPSSGTPLEGTWDEVTAAYQTGLLSPSDCAALEAARGPLQPSSRPAAPSPFPYAPSPLAITSPLPVQPHRHSIIFFVALVLLLVPLIPFVIALDIVIVNFLHLTVFEDFIFMLLSLPATYFLEYLFFDSLLPTLRARLSSPTR